MLTSVPSVPQLPFAVARHLHYLASESGNAAKLLDSEARDRFGCTQGVYRWAIGELEELGFMTYERMPGGRRPAGVAEVAREYVLNLDHWLAVLIANSCPLCPDLNCTQDGTCLAGDYEAPRCSMSTGSPSCEVCVDIGGWDNCQYQGNSYDEADLAVSL